MTMSIVSRSNVTVLISEGHQNGNDDIVVIENNSETTIPFVETIVPVTVFAHDVATLYRTHRFRHYV